MDGVVLYPPLLGMTVGTPSSTMATQVFVVPRSMPTTLSIGVWRAQRCSHRLFHFQSVEKGTYVRIIRSKLARDQSLLLRRLPLSSRQERPANFDMDRRQLGR